jgi:hypothetical protein
MNAIYEEKLIAPSNYVDLSTYTATLDAFTPPLIPGTPLTVTATESAQEIEVPPVDSPRGDTFQLYLREIGQVNCLRRRRKLRSPNVFRQEIKTLGSR